jgi:predicted PurR-regulated permease PerM
MRRVIQVSIVLIAVVVLFVSALAGLVTYYNNVLENKNSTLASWNTQIAKLPSQVTNLTSPNLVTSLGIAEVGNTSSISRSYDRLFIEGSVTNNGQGEALNAGLHVLA